MSTPPQDLPHGSTQTPTEGRYKLEGAGAEKRAMAAAAAAATPSSKEEGGAVQEEEQGPVAAPQPHQVSASDKEDEEYVRRELGKLTRQFSAGSKEKSGGGGASGATATKAAETKQHAQEDQKGADQSVGAADAGAAAVELVEGVVEAAARRLGIGGGGGEKEQA